MRCKSIKREFVCRSQSLWGWEPLPCHSGAANFLLLGAQTCGLPVVLTASQTRPAARISNDSLLLRQQVMYYNRKVKQREHPIDVVDCIHNEVCDVIREV